MNIEEFKKILEYKSLGISQEKVSRIMRISNWHIRKVWKLNEEQFLELKAKEQKPLEQYIGFIMSIIKTTPTISNSNVYYKLLEAFPDCKASESTFYKFIKKLRQETGYERFVRKGTTMRENPIPGEEAQVDFGQYRIKDMYGINRRVYFFVMIMRYSGLKYVYFSSKPFNSLMAIEAHKNAFKFFGGLPKIVLYDQDRVFCINENYGNIILEETFEKYVQAMGFSVVFCSGYSPETKGLVEGCIRVIKENFLTGRTYVGINSLNSACLEWLDNYANNHVITTRGQTSHELFEEEVKKLRKIPKANDLFRNSVIRKIRGNKVTYQCALYETPLGYDGKDALVESDGNIVKIKDRETDKLIVSHSIAKTRWQKVTIDKGDPTGISELICKKYFEENEKGLLFLEKLQSTYPRYYLKSCVRLGVYLKNYSAKEIQMGIEYCLKVNRCTIPELSGFLIYKYGFEKAAPSMSKTKTYSYYKKRALEIAEVEHGKNK